MRPISARQCVLGTATETAQWRAERAMIRSSVSRGRGPQRQGFGTRATFGQGGEEYTARDPGPQGGKTG